MKRHIVIKTPIPGPRSVELMKARQAAIPRGPYNITPLAIARAEGALLEDVDGNRYIDFAGGIGVLNTGHAPKEVVRAIQQQAEKYTHSCVHVTMNEPYIRLAETMNRITPGAFPKKTFFVNTGAEGVENAIKVARNFTRRSGIICFEDAFHGRTLLAMSMTSKVHPYKDHFGPYAPEVHRMPFSYCYRCPWGKRYPGCNIECATFLEDFFKRYVDPTPVACAAALAAIELIEKQNLTEKAARMGEKVRDRFEGLWKRCSCIGNVRGAGAMRAIEFVKDRATKEPAKELVNRITRLCYERGLIVIGAGTYGNVIRTLMPLVITEDQLEEGLDVLEGAILEAAQALQPAPVETQIPAPLAPRPGGPGVSGVA